MSYEKTLTTLNNDDQSTNSRFHIQVVDQWHLAVLVVLGRLEEDRKEREAQQDL